MFVRGATFTFAGWTAKVTGLSVETPSVEIVDMTGLTDELRSMILVPTGRMGGGTVTVDFVGLSDPQRFVGTKGTLSLASQGFSIQRNAILEKATVEIKTGDPVRGSLTFRMTDYYGP